jgi:hypothetical protein
VSALREAAKEGKKAAGSFSSGARDGCNYGAPEDEWSRFGKYSLKTMIPN